MNKKDVTERLPHLAGQPSVLDKKMDCAAPASFTHTHTTYPVSNPPLTLTLSREKGV